MKDGIGNGATRDDHPVLSNQLYASYAKVQDVRSLASVIGEEDLSPTDKLYFECGRRFEAEFLTQDRFENRNIDNTLDLGWKLLAILPRDELERVSDDMYEKHCAKYVEKEE